MNGVLVGIFVYVVLQLIIGLAVSRGIRSEADYLVAGRRIGLGLATFSMFATWFGAESCVSAAGKFYAEGIVGGTTDPFGYALVLFLIGGLLAVPLWRRGLTTLADLFRQRYSAGVERLAAVLMAPTSVFWAAAQIRAFGQVLQSASELGVVICITFAAVVVIVYTCTGGLFADVVTDLVQGIAIVLGLGTLLWVLATDPAVNLGSAWASLDPAKFRVWGDPEQRWEIAELWGLTLGGSLVAQEVFARVLAARSPGVARRATILGGSLYLVVGLVPAFLGLVGASIIPGLKDPEQILPELAERFLSPLLFVIFAGALVSAVLSTVDSTLLAASSLISHNVVVSLKPSMTERQKVRLARVGVAVFGVVAYVLALWAESVFVLVQQANGMGSAGILMLVVFGLFTRHGGARTAYATLTTGLGVWAYGTYLGGWTCSYLWSVAAALVTYLVVGTWERRSVPGPTREHAAGP